MWDKLCTWCQFDGVPAGCTGRKLDRGGRRYHLACSCEHADRKVGRASRPSRAPQRATKATPEPVTCWWMKRKKTSGQSHQTEFHTNLKRLFDRLLTMNGIDAVQAFLLHLQLWGVVHVGVALLDELARIIGDEGERVGRIRYLRSCTKIETQKR